MKILPRPKVNKIKKYWFNNNPSLTGFFEALGTSFPEGEKFFMKSMVYYKPVLPKALVDDLIIFCKQEANHGRMHSEMSSLGHNSEFLQKLETQIGDLLDIVSKYTSPIQQLAITACLEHLTATMGTQLLERHDLTHMMNYDEAEKWKYHSEEEIDHRCVSFDIYKYVGGSDSLRIVAMPIVTIGLIVVILTNWERIMMDDTHRGFIPSTKILFGVNGFITRCIPDYLKWFKPSFYP